MSAVGARCCAAGAKPSASGARARTCVVCCGQERHAWCFGLDLRALAVRRRASRRSPSGHTLLRSWDVSAPSADAARRERRPAAKACTPCCVGRTGRPGARFAFGPLKAGFESSDRLASPIGGSARPCGRRCRLWARDGGLRAHFFAAYFGLDTASRGTRAPSFARLGPVLDAGNLQPSASCCTGSRSDGEDELATKSCGARLAMRP